MINRSHFSRRRRHLMRLMGKDAIAILFAAPLRYRNRDIEYPYRQESDFYYLTGFPEPESAMVLVPGRKAGQYILFCREKDLEKEIWHGRRAGTKGARSQYGADDAFPIEDIDDILPGLLEGRSRVFYTLGKSPDRDQHVIQWVNHLKKRSRSGVTGPDEFIALDRLLHNRMRMIKTAEEIEMIRKAVAISIEGHQRAMRACRPGMNEHQLEAELLYAFRYAGAYPAYNAIVGGGSNGCTLHYTENCETLQDGDLVLIDAAAEYDYYSADITRTFPVNGKFSEPQKALYEIVLAAQEAAIEVARPGQSWNVPHEAAVQVITRGLIKLGLLKGSLNKVIAKEKYKRFYMHRTSHWLGMDVHDVGDYKAQENWKTLTPGMVITVEPGIYIAPKSPGIDPQWWGIGIRIEDDILITSQGHAEILSCALPKKISEIESFMAESKQV